MPKLWRTISLCLLLSALALSVLIVFGSSPTTKVDAGISSTYNPYRHLRAARRYQVLIRQYPTDHGYGVLLTLPLPRRKQTDAIATLAGLLLDEVPTLALILEGPVLSTQEFVSAVTEQPFEYTYFLGKYVLYLWWRWGDGFWPFKFYVSLLIMLYAWWHGNARRAAVWLFMFLFFGWFSGVQINVNVLMITNVGGIVGEDREARD